MQTTLIDAIKHTPLGMEADAILRSCVHCGFCTATCPTYQLLGDELDGPRGRIYLIKLVLEGHTASRKTQTHLDRCLSCRACETTCPSGVRYGRLLEIGRGLVDVQVKRPLRQVLLHLLLRKVLPYPRRFAPLLRLGQWVRPWLPAPLRRKVPPRQTATSWPHARHQRRMLVMPGCVQSAATPNTNAAAARVLDRLGISLISAGGCCGAVSYHLTAHAEGLAFMRRNIDAWWPHVQAGAEAIVMTASGCGAQVKDYGELLKDDPHYAHKAARVSAITRDLSEVLADADLSALAHPDSGRRIAVQIPCTLQHAQQLPGILDSVLKRLGYTLTPVPDAHLCCGSAGTYSILQPRLSQSLLKNKLAALEGGAPDCIVTANVGCQLHLQSAARVPVRHWIELVAEDLLIRPVNSA